MFSRQAARSGDDSGTVLVLRGGGEPDLPSAYVDPVDRVKRAGIAESAKLPVIVVVVIFECRNFECFLGAQEMECLITNWPTVPM